MSVVNIVGGGLAGCEAAWQIAKRGIEVNIYELRDSAKDNKTPAHQTDSLAELVCSNSFRNDDLNSAIGLLHQEMRLMDSLILQAADQNKVPAGSALAVDREGFSIQVQRYLESHPKINIIRQEIEELPEDNSGLWIIATGPLTSDKLSRSILSHTTEDKLFFFDAIAPIIYKDSIDFNKVWMQSRYDKVGPGGNGKDYINCPLTKKQYEEFINDLLQGQKTEFKEWEKDTPYFEGCLPIEVMAGRGIETLRYGPLKPVGLTNPHNPKEKPYAIIQLRQDNKLGTLFNMVGFQTKLKYGEQKRILQKIPGLENAEFARFGGIHRNSFINSPKLLNEKLSLKSRSNIKFAGQISGVEGYVESAAIGLLTGIFSAFEINNKEIKLPPKTTAIGSLLNHITVGHLSDDETVSTFQPMNVNFGLFEKLQEKIKKSERKASYSNRALTDLKEWKDKIRQLYT